jgi:acetylornithine deacetylase/succinyl-diaminopimelate desuccinylase-like protein
VTTVHTGEQVRDRVRELLPELWRTLDNLVRLRSVSVQNPAMLRNTADEVAKLLRGAGAASAEVITIEHDGVTSAPVVYANEKAGGDRPTVLLYAHYDVQPADESKWTKTKPFQPKEITESGAVRLYGRGAADDKSGIVMHLGAIRAAMPRPGKPALNVKVVIEGEEETGKSVLDSYLAAHPDDTRFHADIVVVADTGNVRLGVPTLTSTLRGIVVVDVTLRTLKTAVHSGMYGGPAPDAFMAMVQLLSTLLDHGDGRVTVSGLTEYTGAWPAVAEEGFRANAGVVTYDRTGPRLLGGGTIASRLYGKPSINVVGLSGVPGMTEPVNALRPEVTARISVRLAPNQDPHTAYEALRDHIKKHTPWGIEPGITLVGEGTGFVATRGMHADLIERVLRESHDGREVQHAGQGGSIPLVSAFRRANRNSDIALWGCEEPKANIHGHDESADRAELERLTTAEALLLNALVK